MLFHASDLARRLQGDLSGPDRALEGVSIDSRTVAPGNLFVPLVAERDGHAYVPAALGAGAGAYLSSTGRVEGTADDATAILVADTAGALAEIGRLARERLGGGAVVGVTGSVGKTSMKDLTLAACAGVRVTHASEKSFNNELGVPLTLANAPAGTEVAIVEMGARGKGHIALLCGIARPTVGIVTAVALAHSELFGSIEGVAEAKGELVEALPAGGVAVLNAEDERVAAMAGRTTARVVTYGCTRGDVRATGIVLDDLLRPRFTIECDAGRAEVALDVRGAHMALNAAGAVAAALAVGVPLEAAAAGLAAARLSPWRMDVIRTADGVVVVNDAYNANPTSMRAALEALAALPRSGAGGDGAGGRRVAVLGLMAELGPEGPAEHAAVAAEAARAGVKVVAVGAPAYGDAAVHVPDREAAAQALDPLGPGDAVLVKGSRVAGLEVLAAELVAAHGGPVASGGPEPVR
ncbi:MAG: UDP-N-acetylmuramoyl-tripeptide--D-alanyl-D-alanine ligase [Acidimicrobiia bacterium]|nr:UDP-N-acetylmuramoyl-tripeptide--D-alanyl-D-alanine ligase [Acidimicrobiia bacterium]